MKAPLILFALGMSLPAHASSTTTYTYDALGRLIQSSTTGNVNNGVQMSTTYDAADNRETYRVTGSKDKVVVLPLNGYTVIPLKED
ncbi:hypothetical protein [Sphingobium sp. WCS2017Hpa-17]|uniref:hypothetical protein n=1 Tax=Sphingobium sp. WCS2017Hpa-17 TaxID=3073638 RepID=UPI0028893934|nr:hypothetical protein [Sphingobium sp. WCS2017Hpa-17]